MGQMAGSCVCSGDGGALLYFCGADSGTSDLYHAGLERNKIYKYRQDTCCLLQAAGVLRYFERRVSGRAMSGLGTGREFWTFYKIFVKNFFYPLDK